jgi:autotransporter passenger strand-loop-strand repeat protein
VGLRWRRGGASDSSGGAQVVNGTASGMIISNGGVQDIVSGTATGTVISSAGLAFLIIP